MIKRLLPKTIRGKIIASTAGTTLIIAIATIAVCFSVFQTFLRRNQIQSAEYNLQLVSRNVDGDMQNILYFSNWCTVSPDLVRYLETFQDQAKMPSISSENAFLRTMALNSYERLREEYRNTNANQYITRVLVSPANRKNYLQISDTASSSASVEFIYREPFFQALFDSPDYLWIGIVSDPFSRQQQIIPIIRPIYNQYNSQIAGWSYLSVSDRIICDYLRDFPLEEDSSLYIHIGGHTYRYHDQALSETALEYTPVSSIDHATLGPNSSAQTIRLPDGSVHTMLTCPLSTEGWTISQILSETGYDAQNQVYLLIILGISCIIALLGFCLYLLLNRAISRPVKQIQAKVAAIAEGDFSRDSSIEWEDEFGAIGKGINHMAENVMTLMDRRVEDEKQKKDLEYRILQSQINPHFLYNTLNSIKWMATIQNATGIAEMTTALARLLKNVSKGAQTRITLKEELTLAEDYFLIQQYRYGGSVSMEFRICSDDLYSCQIHRFTLQPIIENALFHGIEPKGCAGKIRITAEAADDPKLGRLLQISITDNGIGMSEETIQAVLHENHAPSATFFQQVGIHNVNQRIQYDFGEAYGITIDSKPGEYTTMIITLPYQTAEGTST